MENLEYVTQNEKEEDIIDNEEFVKFKEESFFPIEDQGDILAVHLSQALDRENSQQMVKFLDNLDALRKSNEIMIVFDFANVKYMNSVAIGSMLNYDWIQEEVYFVNLSSKLKSLFQLFGLTDSLKIKDSYEEIRINSEIKSNENDLLGQGVEEVDVIQSPASISAGEVYSQDRNENKFVYKWLENNGYNYLTLEGNIDDKQIMELLSNNSEKFIIDLSQADSISAKAVSHLIAFYEPSKNIYIVALEKDKALSNLNYLRAIVPTFTKADDIVTNLSLDVPEDLIPANDYLLETPSESEINFDLVTDLQAKEMLRADGYGLVNFNDKMTNRVLEKTIIGLQTKKIIIDLSNAQSVSSKVLDSLVKLSDNYQITLVNLSTDIAQLIEMLGISDIETIETSLSWQELAKNNQEIVNGARVVSLFA